jgi:hypothetical protein
MYRILQKYELADLPANTLYKTQYFVLIWIDEALA